MLLAQRIESDGARRPLAPDVAAQRRASQPQYRARKRERKATTAGARPAVTPRPYSVACRSQLLVAAVLVGAVMCPTCLCGAGWPQTLMLSADHSLNPIISREARNHSSSLGASGMVNRNVVPSAAFSSSRI